METETNKILCTLHPSSPAAHQVVERLARHRPDLVVRVDRCLDDIYPQRSKPGSKGLCFDIVLRSYPGPRNPRTGFIFGRNPKKCDIPIADISKLRRVSNQHFRIYQKSPRVLMLEDFSTNGTWVDYCLVGGENDKCEPGHQNGNKRTLVAGSMISLAPGPEVLRFIVGAPVPSRVEANQCISQLRTQIFRLGSLRPVSTLDARCGVSESESQKVWVKIAEGKDWSIEALSGSKGWEVGMDEVKDSEDDTLKTQRSDCA